MERRSLLGRRACIFAVAHAFGLPPQERRPDRRTPKFATLLLWDLGRLRRMGWSARLRWRGRLGAWSFGRGMSGRIDRWNWQGWRLMSSPCRAAAIRAGIFPRYFRAVTISREWCLPTA